MGMCWAPDCKHYSQRDTCKFFKFPKDKLKKQWMKLIRRDIEPGPGAVVCSCHFKDGKRENGPTLFQHNIMKKMAYPSPERKKRKLAKEVSAVTKETEPILERIRNEDLYMASTSKAPTVVPLDCNISGDEEHEEDQPSTSIASVYVDCPPSTSKEPVLVAAVTSENYFLKQELAAANAKISNLSVQFSYEHICNNDKLVLLYTGIPNNAILTCLLEMIKSVEVKYYLNWNVTKLSREDQVLLTLMKLRQNFPHEDLAVRFSVSQATVTNVLLTWIHTLHQLLFKMLMDKIPSRAQNQLCMPSCFSVFTNCRIILDCTEIFTTVSRSSMLNQKLTFSNYKHRNTWKVLVGVAPNGVITYVSDLYPGSTSDKKIVQHCGLLKQMEAGDLILADKGFLIKDCLPPGVHLNVPPFLTSAQFTPQEVYQTENIARARIHVERAIQRMKCYNILNLIPASLLQHADAVVQVVAALTNLQYPLIKEVQQYYCDEN